MVTAADIFSKENRVGERASRSTDKFNDWIRMTYRLLPIADVVSKATYGKNITIESKIETFFELLYVKDPLLQNLDAIKWQNRSALVDSQNSQRARKRLNALIRAKKRSICDLSLGFSSSFWQDEQIWIGLATISEISDHIIILSYKDYFKFSSVSRVRKIDTTNCPDHNTHISIPSPCKVPFISEQVQIEDDKDKYKTTNNFQSEHGTCNGQQNQARPASDLHT